MTEDIFEKLYKQRNHWDGSEKSRGVSDQYKTEQ